MGSGTLRPAAAAALCGLRQPLLYAREIEPRTSWQAWELLPAFSRLELINAYVHLIREDERIGAG